MIEHHLQVSPVIGHFVVVVDVSDFVVGYRYWYVYDVRSLVLVQIRRSQKKLSLKCSVVVAVDMSSILVAWFLFRREVFGEGVSDVQWYR